VASGFSDVVIVGGGIAGLAAAYELHRRGVAFQLLEAAERPGGVILTEHVDGFTVDAGPDSLLAQKPAAVDLCRELGLGDRLVTTKPPRVAYVLRGSRLHRLPPGSVLGIPTRVGPFLTTRLFSWPGKIRMGAELFVPRRQNADADESVGAFISRRFGREAATYLAEPLLAGIHAGDVDRLSIQSLFPRLVEAERVHGSLLRAFRAQRPAADDGGAFRSLPGGIGELVRALVSVLPVSCLRLRTAVTRIEAAEGSQRVCLASGEALRARAIILATPAFVTAALVQDTDSEIARLSSEIRYVSTATIVLAFDRNAVRHPLTGSGFVVPHVEDRRILAATWISSKWPSRAPDDKVLLRTFAGGARDPSAMELSDEALVRRSLDVLTPLLGIGGEPLLARVYRWDRANAQHEVGHGARLRSLEQALKRHPWLFLTGSGFRGVGIPDCVADGRATAKHVDQWLNPASAA
jgi:oxygen-dependent protoporphyrinogen oxidase